MKICPLISLVCFAAVGMTTIPVGVAKETAPPMIAKSDTDWPWWRGYNRDGIASANQTPPLRWSRDENILWSTKIAGRGHGSVTVLGDRVFVATADHDRGVQLVLALDRASGKPIWQSVVHEGGLETKSEREPNKKASLASSTIATDGDRLYINFLNDDAVWTTALDLNGDRVWQRKVTDYVVHQGYGSSPTIYRNLVIVSADNKGGGAVTAFARETGDVIWHRERPKKPNYSSPVILHAAGRDQLILTGCDLVTSLDPLTGEEFWEIEGATTECVTTAATDGKHIFTSGGYPKNHISAVVADGSGEVAWENNTRAYVPSMLQRNGYLFLVLDGGVATCLRCDSGEQMWKSRLGGTFSSSPVAVGDLIYATSEEGETHIFEANTSEFVSVGMNKLGESVFATPTICGSRIYARFARLENGVRQEYLASIGE